MLLTLQNDIQKIKDQMNQIKEKNKEIDFLREQITSIENQLNYLKSLKNKEIVIVDYESCKYTSMRQLHEILFINNQCDQIRGLINSLNVPSQESLNFSKQFEEINKTINFYEKRINLIQTKLNSVNDFLKKNKNITIKVPKLNILKLKEINFQLFKPQKLFTELPNLFSIREKIDNLTYQMTIIKQNSQNPYEKINNLYELFSPIGLIYQNDELLFIHNLVYDFKRDLFVNFEKYSIISKEKINFIKHNNIIELSNGYLFLMEYKSYSILIFKTINEILIVFPDGQLYLLYKQEVFQFLPCFNKGFKIQKNKKTLVKFPYNVQVSYK
jgi:hypothetical protein